MSIQHRDGDIFHQQDLDGIAHQTNTFGHFGGGIARAIREIFPKASEASKDTCEFAKKNSKEMLGSWQMVDCGGIDILNLYSQEGMGGPTRNTRYDVLADLLVKVRGQLEQMLEDDETYTLGVPYGFGSGLAGGSWTIIEAIFESVFGDCDKVEIVIVKNPKFAGGVTK